VCCGHCSSPGGRPHDLAHDLLLVPYSVSMTSAAVLAGCSAGLAVALAGGARNVARLRLRNARSVLLPEPVAVRAPEGSGRITLLFCSAAIATILMTLGWAPVLLGAAPMAVVMLGRRLRANALAREEAALCAGQLPRAADLVAACLDAGATPGDALDIVRRHVGDPLAARLVPAAGALRVGADPLQAYAEHVGARRAARGHDDPARVLVRALARAMDSGAPVSATVAAVADEQRRRQRWAAEAAARRAGVLAVGPLALCFLPAFVLLGVVPVIVGVATHVLGGLT
jgi:pilus assembly protein TadC